MRYQNNSKSFWFQWVLSSALLKNDNIVHSKSAHSKKKENRQKMPYLSNEKYIEKMPTILNLPGTKATYKP